MLTKFVTWTSPRWTDRPLTRSLTRSPLTALLSTALIWATRQGPLCIAVLVLLLSVGAVCGELKQAAKPQRSLLAVDDRAFVSHSDIVYLSPAEAPVEGLPIGNGNMGTLVWTTPSAVKFQINRSDVYAGNKNHAGSFVGPTDYCGGCAQVAIDVGGTPFEAGEAFQQKLSLYDAECSIDGKDFRVKCFVSSRADVLVLEVDDRRTDPQPLRVTVSMWRDPVVKTVLQHKGFALGTHLARYEFQQQDGRVLVVQQFKEKDYYCGSAVAVQVVDNDVKVETTDQRGQTILVSAKQGKRTILIASSASWFRRDDVAAAAVGLLVHASKKEYDEVRHEHTCWWHDYWSRTFVHLPSDDQLADFMARVRTLHLYYMGSTGRGKLPAKWNGLLFAVNGDRRFWGMQIWVWTTEMLYWPLYAADALDLTDPFLQMYVRQLPAAEKAARQRWGVSGAFFPETTHPDGPVVLPDDAAKEYRDFFLDRKPKSSLSTRTVALCRYDAQLYVTTTGEKPYSYIGHIVSSGSEIAQQAWWRYRYSGDNKWLREGAYPLLRGTVEFYRHLVQKGDDDRYHIIGKNVHEQYWVANDGIMDLAAMRGTVPLAIRAAEIMNVDADLRAEWQELLENLAPYPMGSDPQAKALTGSALAEDVWAAAHLGKVNKRTFNEDVILTPIFPFEDWTLETRDAKTDRIVQKLVDLSPRHASTLKGAAITTAVRSAIVSVRAGRSDTLPAVLAANYAAFKGWPGAVPPLPNGLSLFESISAHSVEHLGLITMTIQESLLQSVSPRPGQPEVIRVFPAWPVHWDASFRLLARGGFLVTSAMRDGKVEFIEIRSRLGERCQLRNPWGKLCRVSQSDSEQSQQVSGEILCFQTSPGKRYLVLPEGHSAPEPRRIVLEPATGHVSYKFTLPRGAAVSGDLGRRKQETHKGLLENEKK